METEDLVSSQMGLRTLISWLWLWLPLCAMGEEVKQAISDTKEASKNSSAHLMVSFPSGGRDLPGYLFRPAGSGPFPAMIFNHGHHKALFHAGPVSDFQMLANFYTSRGFILFVPDRHPQAMEAHEYSAELQEDIKRRANDPEVKTRKLLENWEIVNRDVGAAVQWLKQQPNVDTNRVYMSGVFSGAIQALLSAEKDWGVRAYVVFSPAASTWNDMPILQPVLRRTVRTSAAPIFLINPRNVRQLEPAEVLGKELDRKNGLNRAKIYPPFGPAQEYGKMFPLQGCDIWGSDVAEFLDEVSK